MPQFFAKRRRHFIQAVAVDIGVDSFAFGMLAVVVRMLMFEEMA
jgi:hypothetical protein